jgi:hypothetical protein
MVAFEGDITNPATASAHNQPPQVGYNYVALGKYALGAMGMENEYEPTSAAYPGEYQVSGREDVDHTAQAAVFAATATGEDGALASFFGSVGSYIGSALGHKNHNHPGVGNGSLKTSLAHGLAPQPELSIAASHLPQIEQDFINQFNKHVGMLDLTTIMVPIDGRTVAHPETFRVIPIVSRNTESSLGPSGSVGPGDPAIKCTYGSYDSGYPYLDTRQAIGLVKGDHLIAVAGAGVDDQGQLKIIQIQDVTGLKKPAGRGSTGWSEFFASGLHDGFRWRDTLVAGWEEVARSTGIRTILIQSYRNNNWDTVSTKDRSYAYDEVAQRMGYRQVVEGKKGKDWLKEL